MPFLKLQLFQSQHNLIVELVMGPTSGFVSTTEMPQEVERGRDVTSTV